MKLNTIQRSGSSAIELSWDDGHQGHIELITLRDACPCAGCKGETVLLEHYGPPPTDFNAPGRYELRSAESVGNYALKLIWGDGHNDGLYTWDILRRICECEACSRKGMENGSD